MPCMRLKFGERSFLESETVLPAAHDTIDSVERVRRTSSSIYRSAPKTEQWSKNFDVISHRRGWSFLGGQCNVTPVSREHCSRLSCRYRRLNDPFCCVHLSSDSQCVLVGRKTPKIAPSCGIATPFNTWFFGPMRVSPPNGISIGLQPF